MVNAKQKPILNSRSFNSLSEDERYHLYIQHKIDLALEDIKNGNVISHEDLKKEVETW